METIEGSEEVEENEELQRTLYSALEDLLFFLKQCPLTGSFKADPVKDIVKLGQGQERPVVNSYIMPIAASCLPMLFAFLSEGTLETVEDHILCADAAASLLSMFPPKRAATLVDHIFVQVTNNPGCVVDFSKGTTEIFMKLVVAKPLGFKLGMAKALLRNTHCLTPTVMVYMVEPITIACYQYSSLTCLAFRTLHLWLTQWNKMDFCLDRISSRNIYSIVADNWENHMPGVRKENVKVFEALLDVACSDTEFTVEGILEHVLEDLSWKMKSKYFYLSMLLPRVGVLKALQKHSCIIPALVATLGITRLNSAGTDTYRVCLNAVPDVDSWCDWFLQPILELLISQMEQDRLAQINLLSRWLTPTLRRFPSLTQILHSRLASLKEENPSVDLALSGLIHQGRKQGYIANLWPQHSFIDSYLIHPDEEVRKNAFGAVCKRTKKISVPPPEEFLAVKKFLKENVNSDCTTLRQSIIDSFSHFLERLFESSVKLVTKKGERTSSIFTFLNWMHEFLLENLKLGGNYQRTVTSLRLYLEILKWFGPGDVKTSGRAEPVRSMAKDLDLWPFESQESWDVVLTYALHPTEDIQKVAAAILGDHLQLLDAEGKERRAARVWQHTLQQCRSALFYEVESGRHLMRLLVGFLKENPDLACIIPVANKVQVRKTEGSKDLVIQPKEPFREQETGVQKLISFWLCEVKRQWTFCKKDVYAAVTSGSPMHGALAGLLPLIPHFSHTDVDCVLVCLGPIVSHFLKCFCGLQDNSHAGVPSFVEMTEAVKGNIPEEVSSRHKVRLSPAHQLLLSCLWLTLKEACSLASTLLCHSRALGMDAVRCIIIAERISLRSRYKGTIEAAGAALAIMVQQITSPQEKRRCLPSFLPDCGEKLSDFLEDMLSRVLRWLSLYSLKTSVTRRCAGVAVLVQKIIAYDSRPNKPLLRMCLRRLCEMAEMPSSMPEESSLETLMLEWPSLEWSTVEVLEDPTVEEPSLEESSPEEPAQERFTLERPAQEEFVQEGHTQNGPMLEGPTPEETNPEGAVEDRSMHNEPLRPMPEAAAPKREKLQWPMLEGVMPKGLSYTKGTPKSDAKRPVSNDSALDGSVQIELARNDPALDSALPEELLCGKSKPGGFPQNESVPEGLEPKPEGSPLETPAPKGPTPEQCDVPQASALHLLCRLVQDASLRAELLPFSSALALLCFNSFTSPLWPVRNAALQLFGVLVPVLVGEKKVRNDNKESYGNLTTEEFLSHHPSIVAFILEEMQKTCEDPDSCKCIVPILSLLSRLTFGDSWSTVNCSIEIQHIQTYLNLLVKDSRVSVRKLAAKCCSRFISKNSVAESIGVLCTEMKGAKSLGPNEFHGKVKLLKYMVLRLIEEDANVETFRCVRRLVQEVSLIDTTWISRMTLIEVMLQLERHCNDKGVYDSKRLVEVVVHVLNRYALMKDVEPGVDNWAARCIAFATSMCSETELDSIWMSLFANQWDSLLCVCVRGIQSRVPTLSTSTKVELANTLLCCTCHKWSDRQNLLRSIFITILDLTSSVNFTLSFKTICRVFKNTKEEDIMPCWSVVLPLCCELFARVIRNLRQFPQPEKDFLRNLVLEFRAQTFTNKWDENTHIRTAKSFVVLFQELSHLRFIDSDVLTEPLYVDIVNMVLDCGIDLLQNENEAVRKEASKCLVPELNPYISLQMLLSGDGLLCVLNPFQIASYFQSKLLDFSSYEAELQSNASTKEDEAVAVSPFGTGSGGGNASLEEGHALRAMAASYFSLLEDDPPWLKDLHRPPIASSVEKLVTGLLCKWNETANDATSSMSKLNILLLRLKVLAHAGAKLLPSSSPEDYANLLKPVQSALSIY